MKKIIFAVLAISAIALLNSCENKTSGPKDFPNGPTQTNTNSITYTGTIDGQYLDVDMVPVRMCSTNELVWPQFADDLYKIGVEANQYVAKGHRVDVTMRIVKPWFAHDYFEIIDVKIFPKMPVSLPFNPVQTPTPVVKKPVRNRQGNGNGNSGRDGGCFPIHEGRRPIWDPQPITVIAQPQPCCCGTNITINGTNNAPITVNGDNNNDGGTAPIQIPAPVWRPVVPLNDCPSKDFNTIPNGKLKADSVKTNDGVRKKEPWTTPWN